MNKIVKFSTIIILVCSIMLPYEHKIMADEKTKNNFQKQYSWLNKTLYKIYKMRSEQYNVPLKFALCVIKNESNGRNTISRLNRNGTRDY